MNTLKTAQDWLDKHGAEASAQPLADVLCAYGEQVRGETYAAVLMALDRFLSAARALDVKNNEAARAMTIAKIVDWIRAQRDRR